MAVPRSEADMVEVAARALLVLAKVGSDKIFICGHTLSIGVSTGDMCPMWLCCSEIEVTVSFAASSPVVLPLRHLAVVDSGDLGISAHPRAALSYYRWCLDLQILQSHGETQLTALYMAAPTATGLPCRLL